MSLWLIRIGALCLFSGIIAVSPLMDFLPIDLFFINQSSNPHVHYRVVSAKQDDKAIGIEEAGIATIVSGLALLCEGLIMKHRSK